MGKEEKRLLRRYIAEKKKSYSQESLSERSFILLNELEKHPAFTQAETVLLYYSLPDEVQTHDFVEKWSRSKKIILPVVKGDELELRSYTGKQDLQKGSYGIEEPQGELFSDYDKIDLAIIPGVAFDLQGNRLGRGKGYYDRLLKQLKAYKIGICFDFQICEQLPTEEFDKPMNEIWSEQRHSSPAGQKQ